MVSENGDPSICQRHRFRETYLAATVASVVKKAPTAAKPGGHGRGGWKNPFAK
jgi:hypothetical protein